MGMLSAFRGWFGGNSGALSETVGTQSAAPTYPLVSDVQNVGIDGALQVSAVWSAVEKTVKTVSTLPLMVYEERGEGLRVLARGSLLWSLLHDSPNDRMTPSEFWSAMLMNLIFRGNAYARLTRNADGRVVSMWPMAADQTEVSVLDDGSIVYEYRLGADVAVFAADAVLHIKDLGNGTIGLARLDYMRATLSEAGNAQAHANRTFSNAAKPAGILMIDKVLNQQQRDAIREKFAELSTGPMARLFILEAAMKYEPVGMSPADVQLLETRKFSVNEIARWFGIPAVLLESVDMTNHEAIIQTWLKTSIRPLLVQIEQAIRKRVFTVAERARYSVEWNFDGLLRASAKDRFELYAKGVQNGIMTRREARQLENLPPRPDMDDDILTAQMNLAPLNLLATASAADSSNDPRPIAQ